MKNLFNAVIAGVALCIPAITFAGPGNPMSDIGTDGGTFSDYSTGSGAFTDVFSFDLTAGAGYWTATDVLTGSTGVTGLTLSLLDDGAPVSGTTSITYEPVGGPSSGVSYELVTDTFPALLAGSYTLDVSGTFLSAGSGYGGYFKVIPAVPEPSTWLAMAVGLGLMAFSASRHRKSNV